ncbi:MAG TPA: IS630 family transposase [Mucilaginibacter sp.]
MNKKNLPKQAINAIRRAYIKGDLKAYQIAEKLHIAYTTVYNYCKLFGEIKRLHPDKLADMNFFIPVKRKIQDKSEHYLPCITILPELIRTDTTKKLSGRKLFKRYKAIYPGGYSLTHFQSIFTKWKNENGFNTYSISKVGFISAADNVLLNQWRNSNNHRYWQRAVVIEGSFNGRPLKELADKVEVNILTADSWVATYKTQGINGLILKQRASCQEILDKISQKVENVIKLLHQAPMLYNINRTSWRREDLALVYEHVYGSSISVTMVSKYLKKSGYNFRKAKKVLTSPDLNFQEKLNKITDILKNLGPEDRFFSIDEMGPIGIRVRGGRSLMKNGELRTILKRQKSKGSLIVTAAVELITNQVTHFYSYGKNTTEMMRLLDVLLEQYKPMKKIYLSWDAVSWHRSKILKARVNEVNSDDFLRLNQTPRVFLAPLPTSSQFLNVIESVFSGLARAVIHNSDYPGVQECKVAIDRHFAERNAYFIKFPKRAGKKIWGNEIVKPIFHVANNCKDPRDWG